MNTDTRAHLYASYFLPVQHDKQHTPTQLVCQSFQVLDRPLKSLTTEVVSGSACWFRLIEGSPSMGSPDATGILDSSAGAMSMRLPLLQYNRAIAESRQDIEHSYSSPTITPRRGFARQFNQNVNGSW